MPMSTLQVYQYKGFNMEFEVIDGEVYANATAMSKPFGRNTYEWMRLPNTIRYAEGLKALRENPVALTIKRLGGPGGGGSTWIHEKLILKLAQWLDVDFEIWCNDIVSQVMKQGRPSQLPDFTNPALAARAWADQVEQRMMLEQKQQALLLENAE